MSKRLSDDEKRFFTDQISMLKGENERLTKTCEDLEAEKNILIEHGIAQMKENEMLRDFATHKPGCYESGNECICGLDALLKARGRGSFTMTISTDGPSQHVTNTGAEELKIAAPPKMNWYLYPFGSKDVMFSVATRPCWWYRIWLRAFLGWKFEAIE